MLRLQARHFGVDAKNKINKASLDSVKQRNVQFEQAKKDQINTSPYRGAYSLRPKWHREEIGEIVDKITLMDEVRKPSGLKNLNHAR